MHMGFMVISNVDRVLLCTWVYGYLIVISNPLFVSGQQWIEKQRGAGIILRVNI